MLTPKYVWSNETTVLSMIFFFYMLLKKWSTDSAFSFYIYLVHEDEFNSNL